MQPEWAALGLGVGAIPIATQLTCYYQAALFGLALLVARSEMVGVALCLLAAATQWLWFSLPYSDVKFVWMRCGRAPGRARGDVDRGTELRDRKIDAIRIVVASCMVRRCAAPCITVVKQALAKTRD